MNKRLMTPAIILISPQMGENIGAAARAMYNFGLTDLRIVNPRDGWPNEAAITMAAGAKAIIENAKCYKSTEDSISDCNYIAATTARQRDITIPNGSPRNICTELKNKKEQKIGFMFGCEKSGLNNDDISYANTLIHIDVNPDYGSINLAQAVGIISYEWRTIQVDSNIPQKEINTANKNDITHLYNHLQEALNNTDFLNLPEKKEGMLRNIRAMLYRCSLTTQEVQTLRGILKSLEKI